MATTRVAVGELVTETDGRLVVAHASLGLATPGSVRHPGATEQRAIEVAEVELDDPLAQQLALSRGSSRAGAATSYHGQHQPSGRPAGKRGDCGTDRRPLGAGEPADTRRGHFRT